MHISVSNHSKKTMNTKTYFCLYYILIKFTHIRHKNNTDITQSSARNTFITYLRKKVKSKLNILMKTKLGIKLNRKSD